MTVSQPARAVAWAMPRPIWPAPSTPTLRIAITLSSSAVGGLMLPGEPPDALDHLLERGLLSEDHRHPRIAQGVGDHFRAPVVAVQAGLGHEHADGSAGGHGRSRSAQPWTLDGEELLVT